MRHCDGVYVDMSFVTDSKSIHNDVSHNDGMYVEMSFIIDSKVQHTTMA